MLDAAQNGDRPRAARGFLRVWRGRCPRCGEGALHVSFARLARSCEHCGLVYRREQGAMTGSMYLSAAVTQVFAAALILFVFLGTPLGTLAAILVTLPVVAGFCAWFLPRSQALWVAVEHWTDARDAAGSPRRG